MLLVASLDTRVTRETWFALVSDATPDTASSSNGAIGPFSPGGRIVVADSPVPDLPVALRRPGLRRGADMYPLESGDITVRQARLHPAALTRDLAQGSPL